MNMRKGHQAMAMRSRDDRGRSHRPIRRWVRRGFLLWAVFSLSWLANSVRTQGVADALLRNSGDVTVSDGPTGLTFLPAKRDGGAALIFICGAGIHPHAYAPLLRPVATTW